MLPVRAMSVTLADCPVGRFTQRISWAGLGYRMIPSSFDTRSVRSSFELRRLFPPQTVDLFATENGDIVGCGQFNYFALPIEPDSSFIGSWIFRLDGNGQLKWIRHFNDARYESPQYLIAGVELDNQDLAFTGTLGFFGPPEGLNAWLLKIDSMGCITSVCGEYQTIVSAPDIPDSGLLFTLHPNPGTIATEIQLPQPAPGDCQIAVYNLLGGLVEQQTVPEGAQALTLALHGYSNGVYLVALYERQKVVGRARLVVQR